MKTDPCQLDAEDNEIVPQGQLEVTCVEISRLSLPVGAQSIYCTMAIGESAYNILKNCKYFQQIMKDFLVIHISYKTYLPQHLILLEASVTKG